MEMASQSPPLSNINGVSKKKSSTSPTKGQALPPGWERLKSDQGAYYYWNKKTGKTSWKFPEEEAKAHHQKVKKHSYENIQLQVLAEKKKGPLKSNPDERLKSSGTDEHHTYVNAEELEHHTYMNVNTSATTTPVDHTHNTDWGDLILPPPPPAILQKREEGGGSSPHSQVTTPTLDLPPRTNGRETERERSPTPPIPDRKYSETDIRMSPPPPLPQRQYSNEDTLSPPPLPERRYTATDVGDVSGGNPPAAAAATAVAVGQRQGQMRNGPTRNQDTRDRSKSLDSDHDSSMKYEISEMGHQYALVTKGKSVANSSSNENKDKNKNAPPPLPKRFRERFNEDSPFSSSENISQAGDTCRNSGYVDIDHSEANSDKTVYTDTIAYAVVKVDGSSNDTPTDRRPIRRVKTPRPYEDVSATTPPPLALAADSRPKRVPAYEEIVTDNSPHDEMDADGYMKVKRTNTGSILHVKSKTSDSPGRERHIQVKQQSLDQPLSFPPLPARPDTTTTAVGAASSSKVEPEYQTPDMKHKTPGNAESEEGGLKIQGEASSQDSESVFDSSMRYDLPSNSRRLNAMNVTLRRNDADAAVPGYSKLDLSKEALLLRSGVTLRRLNHYSLSSVSSFMREDGTPEEEGSEVGSGTTPDTMTDEEDVLEPVSKCINSLRNSLGMDVDQTDNEPYVPMARAPTGPPAWMNFKRRPHAYEDVQGGSQDETRSGLTSTFLCDSNSEVSKSMSDFDMVWDNSDIGMELTGTNYASTAGSSSQPNLLHEQQETNADDPSFPHLVKPSRVSEEAFQLRKTRLKHHKYEDVEEAPGVGGTGGPVGDVNALTSAVRESWLEGGDKNSPPESGKSKLPQGWRKLKDDNGKAYFWHVPTGQTQYKRPSREEVKRLSLSVEEGSPQSSHSPPPPVQQKLKSLTFSACYLGYQHVMESELVPGQCVEVVHSCVRELTAALSEQPSSADQGKAVFLQIHNMELRWLNPADSSAVSVAQPINRIRVWGIGLENERDFGYVARDSVTKKHKCHVFRCDVPARAVARALLESHQNERTVKAQRRRESSGNANTTAAALQERRKRDSTEGSSGRSMSPEVEISMQGNPPSSSRPRVSTSPMSYSPMRGSHEHYERIECTYIGSCEVPHGMGMEILNEAVDKLSNMTHRWLNVNVDVATSSIKISDTITDRVLCEHRVRFLCFLGIARDDHFCGYILDGGERDGEKVYMFHGFKKEPNTDRICLALHTACQARYKRVLEAHPEVAAGKDKRRSKESPDRGKVQTSTSSSLFGRLGSLRKVKKPVDDDRSQGFVVQYCGFQSVSRPDGLETVKEVVQQLAVPKLTSSSAAPAHLVEFDISPSGISITDPQKTFFGRKHFSSKIITYVLRIRNYFAFVAKESGRFYCHVFLETEVDAGTIVTTMQKLLAPDSAKQHKK